MVLNKTNIITALQWLKQNAVRVSKNVQFPLVCDLQNFPQKEKATINLPLYMRLLFQ